MAFLAVVDVPFFQLQSALGVMNDTETCLQQPAGPTPGLCEYQPEAALVACQTEDRRGTSQVLSPHMELFLTHSCGSPRPGLVPLSFSSEELRRQCRFRSLCLCVCFGLLCSPIFDPSLLSCCLLLVPGGAQYMLALEEIPGGCIRLLNGGLDEQS